MEAWAGRLLESHSTPSVGDKSLEMHNVKLYLRSAGAGRLRMDVIVDYNLGKQLPDLAEISVAKGRSMFAWVCLLRAFEAPGSNAVQCLTSEDVPMTAAP